MLNSKSIETTKLKMKKSQKLLQLISALRASIFDIFIPSFC